MGGDGDASGASKLEYAGRATRLVRVIRLVRLIKLLRILRVVPLFKRVQRRLELRFAVLRIVKYLTPIPLAPRLAACCAVRALRCARCTPLGNGAAITKRACAPHCRDTDNTKGLAVGRMHSGRSLFLF